MLMLMGILYCVLVIECAPTANQDDSNLLATILFYKDINGKIVLATGTVPNAVVDVVRDDIRSRIDGANVTIAPIFQSPQDIPEAVDVMDYVKNTYGTVFITEALPKKISRTIMDEMWNSDWLGFLKTDSRKSNSLKLNVPRAHVSLALGYTDEYDKMEQINTSNCTGNCKFLMLETVKYKKNEKTIPTKFSIIPTKKRADTITTTQKTTVRTTPKTTVTQKTSSVSENEDEFSEFVPNGIYYGIHKKCVNWANGCNFLNALDKPSNQFNYVQRDLVPEHYFP